MNGENNARKRCRNDGGSSPGSLELQHHRDAAPPACSSSSEETNNKHASSEILKVVIVGGGIAGLGCALALQQQGFHVSVFERDTTFADRRQGYGLTLVNNPKGPLATLKLLDQCIAEDCPSNAHWLFRPEGTILGYYGRSFKPSLSTTASASSVSAAVSSSSNSVLDGKSGGIVEGRGNLRIPRQNLRKMMLDKLLPGTVQWGMKIVDYDELDDRVVVKFQSSSSSLSAAVTDKADDNPCDTSASTSSSTTACTSTAAVALPIVEITADVLVGADGIRSIVRQLRGQKPGRILGNGGSSSQGKPKPLGETSPLHYVGVAVILGITSAIHPLIAEQGFYCLDGVNRLFTMPFEASGECDNDAMVQDSGVSDGQMKKNLSAAETSSSSTTSSSSSSSSPSRPATKLTMWQLSFSGLTEAEASLLKTTSSSSLLAEARRRTEGWFAPVRAMIDGTPDGEVWGTGLYDRNPMSLWAKDRGSRVTVIGDACHPMSMFKGQGANQALQDGPLLASWLHTDKGQLHKDKGSKQHKDKGQQGSGDKDKGRVHNGSNAAVIGQESEPSSSSSPSSPSAGAAEAAAASSSSSSSSSSSLFSSNTLYTRLRCFEREMVARTAPKVQASRAAASHLHSPAVFGDDYGVDGVPSHCMGEVLRRLQAQGLGAHQGGHLVEGVRTVIDTVIREQQEHAIDK